MSDMSSGSRNDKGTRTPAEGASWVIGLVLIVLGVAFMAERTGYLTLAGNWWAVFIYIAAVASLLNAWRAYRSNGASSSVTGSVVWGLVLTVVATILFFGLAWDVWWPGILIAVGVGIVIGHLMGDRSQP